jgi:voltage-gated potassium channel
LIPALVLLLLIAAIGVAGYMLIERWDFVDSLYMVVITLFTIGYEEVHPLSGGGRIFTMFIVVGGVGTAVYAVGRAVEIAVEGEMSGYQKRRRMDKKIRQMVNHYVVCGYGRVGHQVAKAFSSSDIPYVVIDSKPGTSAELEPLGVPYIIGDGTSDDVLRGAGIESARGLVACSDSDVANVYVTLSARALNPRLYIVARAGDPEIEKKLLMAGANRVISPYFIAGLRMAALATQPVTSDFLDLVTHGGQVDYRLYEITVADRSGLAGKSLAEADIPGASGAMVLGIRKADRSFDLQPRSNSRLESGDVLVVIGTQQHFASLEKMNQ